MHNVQECGHHVWNVDIDQYIHSTGFEFIGKNPYTTGSCDEVLAANCLILLVSWSQYMMVLSSGRNWSVCCVSVRVH